MMVAGVVWKLFVGAEAGHAAATAKRPESTVPMARLTYAFLAIIFVAAAVISDPDQFKSKAGFVGFKVPSAFDVSDDLHRRTHRRRYACLQIESPTAWRFSPHQAFLLLMRFH